MNPIIKVGHIVHLCYYMKAYKDFFYCHCFLLDLERLYYLKTIELDFNVSLEIVYHKQGVRNFSLMDYLKISFALLIFKAFLNIQDGQLIFW